ncbi:transcription factor HES-1 isoform X1 [Notechis scutatus]|uniref:Transcription factor HES-1 isoform X1 n=1 Tax=Notechis scutatus TaxID=8663 RepID=A0A6J1VIE4_9SAUR|nr:transcription factor HES-1 isoform X1 [Notechis scutatus]
MPADLMEKSSSSPPAATPTSAHATPDKPRTAAEQRKVKEEAGGGPGGGAGRGRLCAARPTAELAFSPQSSKPVMEKRRRARINESLGQLKTLILDALKKDSSRHSKLEKADILEMTVKHLRSLQRAQMTAALNTDPSVLCKYRAGFNECMTEVTRFLSSCEGVNTEVRNRLLGHLAGCLSQISALNYPALQSSALPPAPCAQHGASLGQPLVQMPAGTSPPSGSVASCKLSNPAGESAKGGGGFQLVPASDGQFAFLIPNAAFAAHGSAVIPLYASSGPPAASLPSGSGAPSLPADSLWRPW